MKSIVLGNETDKGSAAKTKIVDKKEFGENYGEKLKERFKNSAILIVKK